MGVSVIDGFLDDFDALRAHCDAVDYSGEVNPYDGVTYPGISFDIPDKVRKEVVNKLRAINPKLFLRITYEGERVPHSAHNDRLMGKKGCIIFLNRESDCKGGTSFVRHKVHGMEFGPETDDQLKVWQRDTNNYDSWDITSMVNMAPNRALIFDSERMHRAETPSAFGNSPKDGRLAMVCFYD